MPGGWSGGATDALKAIAGQMAARSYAPLFPIQLVEKDFRYIVESATQVNAPVPISEAVRDVYARALCEGYGDDNISGIAQLFDETEKGTGLRRG